MIACIALLAVSQIARDYYGLWLRLPGGAWIAVPWLAVYALIASAIVCLAIYLIKVLDGAHSSAHRDRTAKETREQMASADSLDHEAARLRALKRRLDAETDLIESEIRAALRRDELSGIAEQAAHERSMRDLSRGKR